eukprot:CAMPEP_0175102012 /NCGR_PEP_ID=MMETSP0086_2-20121207/8170_1 /TAXON_ID=136419 /ORGANISM="Unknown Unknown, Strain D1" /LENGTH=298 /DNA_ID=CAMNT_0016376715 /DNA_START=145 /DNA_END=1041 /DNA_ORIENTATION=+
MAQGKPPTMARGKPTETKHTHKRNETKRNEAHTQTKRNAHTNETKHTHAQTKQKTHTHETERNETHTHKHTRNENETEHTIDVLEEAQLLEEPEEPLTSSNSFDGSDQVKDKDLASCSDPVTLTTAELSEPQSQASGQHSSDQLSSDSASSSPDVDWWSEDSLRGVHFESAEPGEGGQSGSEGAQHSVLETPSSHQLCGLEAHGEDKVSEQNPVFELINDMSSVSSLSHCYDFRGSHGNSFSLGTEPETIASGSDESWQMASISEPLTPRADPSDSAADGQLNLSVNSIASSIQDGYF